VPLDLAGGGHEGPLDCTASRRIPFQEWFIERADGHRDLGARGNPETMQDRRDVLLARLRSQGALALEAGPKLSPTLVNAYLEVKQRNRL